MGVTISLCFNPYFKLYFCLVLLPIDSTFPYAPDGIILMDDA